MEESKPTYSQNLQLGEDLCDTGTFSLLFSFQRNIRKLISKAVLILDSRTNDVSFLAIRSLHK